MSKPCSAFLIRRFPLGLLLTSTLAARLAAQDFTPAIEDNSFFIEEAYNQEPGVVQHIATGFVPGGDEDDGALSFTQEWPFLSQTHQLSYTVPYLFLDADDASGVGDVLLNYRYQWLSGGRTAVAPRLSLILPTGDEDEGLGDGSPGLQINLPVSHRLSDPWIAHFNLGATWLAEVEAPGRPQDDSAVTSFFAGASVIWLARPPGEGVGFNGMLEWLSSYDGELDDRGGVDHEWTTVLSPGARWSFDRGDLQIVPGVALPITWSGGDSSVGVFAYLSFEHPF